MSASAALPDLDAPGPWRRRVLGIALPVMLANASVPLTGIVDTALMGRLDDPAWIGATALGATLFSSIYWVFSFLRQGTGGLSAQAYGAGQSDTLLGVVRRALLVAFLAGVLLWLLSPALLWLGLNWIEGSSKLHERVEAYFSIRILSAPITLMLYVVFGTLIGLQRTRTVLMLQLLLNLGNVALNLLLFNTTALAIQGVALATVMAELMTLIAALSRLQHVLPTGLWPRDVRATVRALLDRTALLRFFSLSGDLFIRTACLTFAFYWLNLLGSRQGDLTLAANALLLQLLHLMAYALDGFADATETLAGAAWGAKRPRALRRALRAAIEGALICALLFSGLYALAGPSLLGLLTTQEAVLDEAMRYLPWIIAGPLVGLWSYLLDGLFIGTTRTRAMRNAMLVSVGVFLSATHILVPMLGNHGLWLSYHVLMILRTISLGLALPMVFRGPVEGAN